MSANMAVVSCCCGDITEPGETQKYDLFGAGVTDNEPYKTYNLIYNGSPAPGSYPYYNWGSGSSNYPIPLMWEGNKVYIVKCGTKIYAWDVDSIQELGNNDTGSQYYHLLDRVLFRPEVFSTGSPSLKKIGIYKNGSSSYDDSYDVFGSQKYYTYIGLQSFSINNFSRPWDNKIYFCAWAVDVNRQKRYEYILSYDSLNEAMTCCNWKYTYYPSYNAPISNTYSVFNTRVISNFVVITNSAYTSPRHYLGNEIYLYDIANNTVGNQIATPQYASVASQDFDGNIYLNRSISGGYKLNGTNWDSVSYYYEVYDYDNKPFNFDGDRFVWGDSMDVHHSSITASSRNEWGNAQIGNRFIIW